MRPYHSTRKNPDKYIDNLKDEIERLMEINKDHWRRGGVHEFRYKHKAVDLNVALDDPLECEKLFPGTEVIFKGKVTEVHRTEHDSNIKFNVSTCRRIEPHK